jgi:putative transposase
VKAAADEVVYDGGQSGAGKVPLEVLFYRLHSPANLLAERGVEVSNESVRRWVLKFGPRVARNLGQTRPKPHDRRHLDEMAVSIAGQHMLMWRTVDSEGEVLDVLVRSDATKRPL